MATRKPKTAQPLDDGVIAIRKTVFHSAEDGMTGTLTTNVFLDVGVMQFTIDVPRYFWLKGVPEGGPTISGDSAKQVIDRYEAMADEYSKIRLATNGVRMLWVGAVGRTSEFAREAFSLDVQASLGYRCVTAYGKDSQTIVHQIDAAGVPFGEPIVFSKELPAILVDDTPEIRAHLDKLKASIGVAGEILEGIRDAKDPAAYIMQISPDFGTAPSVQAAETTSTTVPVDDPDEEL